MWTLPNLHSGDRVRVRSEAEILATLAADGTVDGMPFMPEMLQYCGKELAVASVAHKTCDTANRTGGRKLDRTVHLEGSRCDGRAHGGCQAECNLFWKEAWLERVDGAKASNDVVPVRKGDFTAAQLDKSTRVSEPGTEPVRYRCQATQLYAASKPLPWWNVRQFLLDVRTGNERPGKVLRILFLSWLYQLLRLPAGFRIWNGLYEWAHLKLIGKPTPHVIGTIPTGDPTPAMPLGLKPGEAVRIRPPNEIAVTLNRNNKNRGIWFGPEMTPYCGGTYKVRKSVTQIINESTGEMMLMKTPCITLDDVLCKGHYSSSRLFCPRLITPYWREMWLERVKQQDSSETR